MADLEIDAIRAFLLAGPRPDELSERRSILHRISKHGDAGSFAEVFRIEGMRWGRNPFGLQRHLATTLLPEQPDTA